MQFCPLSGQNFYCTSYYQGRIQDFKLGGAHIKKLHRVEGGAKILGVFRVKHHDFTPKNLIFSNCGGSCEIFLGISCEKKSRFYAKRSYFFQFQGGGGGARLVRPLDPPLRIVVNCSIRFVCMYIDIISILLTHAVFIVKWINPCFTVRMR